ncbi:MAG: type II secretion system protein [Planctomycetota bacterium]
MRPRARQRTRRAAACAFTLVEILIVVAILGILAAIVVPQFASATASAGQSAFATNVRAYAQANALYYQDFGEYFEDSGTGNAPVMFGEYFDVADFESETPIGGEWDFENNGVGGYEAAVGVVFTGAGTTQDDAFMEQVDRIFDDGDLANGGFREIEDNVRYYQIVSR